jgi:hypothetical protein
MVEAPVSRSRFWLGVALWLIGTLPFLTRLHTGWTSWDLGHYFACARAFLDGAGIYSRVPFEYPPYALAWFAGPASAAVDVEAFRQTFGLLIWTLDAAIKAVLLWLGLRGSARRDLVPFVAYTLTTTALGHILLQRFDVIPAALSVVALVAFARRWTGVAGAIIGIAIGTKAYPALFVPIMMAAAWRRDRSRSARFIAGVAVALAPLGLVSLWGPWWRFVSAHTGRGLEAESLWASAIWLLHYAGLAARWEIVTAWVEVTGSVAAALVTPVRVVWLMATLVATALAARLAWRGAGASEAEAGDGLVDATPVATLALLLLVPAATFVTLGPVLSPQYHLWLTPLAAIALLGRHDPSTIAGAPLVRRALGWLVVSGFLVPAFFPSRTFDTGLDLGRTLVLVARNGLLVYATTSLWRAMLRGVRA